MAIVRATSPLATPAALADWQRAVAQLELAHKNGNNLYPAKESGGSWYVPKGYCFYFSGTIYYADADTLISGTRSNYIQMTASVDGATCTAAFLASLTGVTWDDSWNAYFDASANLVIVDEYLAIGESTLTVGKTLLGAVAEKAMTSGIYFKKMFSNNRLPFFDREVQTGMTVATGDVRWFTFAVSGTNAAGASVFGHFVIRSRTEDGVDTWQEIKTPTIKDTSNISVEIMDTGLALAKYAAVPRFRTHSADGWDTITYQIGFTVTANITNGELEVIQLGAPSGDGISLVPITTTENVLSGGSVTPRNYGFGRGKTLIYDDSTTLNSPDTDLTFGANNIQAIADISPFSGFLSTIFDSFLFVVDHLTVADTGYTTFQTLNYSDSVTVPVDSIINPKGSMIERKLIALTGAGAFTALVETFVRVEKLDTAVIKLMHGAACLNFSGTSTVIDFWSRITEIKIYGIID